MPDLTELARLVDDGIDDDVVVFGSLPENARDLDILCSLPAAKALGVHLDELGFHHREGTWLRIDHGRSWVVDVTLVDEAGVPPDLAGAVVRAAVPLPGRRHLRRPAPHHDLLLLAARLAPTGGMLEARRVERIDRAVADDPDAWARAAQEAGHHDAGDRLVRQLADLRAAYEGGRVGEPREAIASTLRAHAGRLAGRRPRGGVIAVSGVDGAGKSTQTKVLAEAFNALGYETDVKWTRITYDPSLERIARPVKVALALLQGRRHGSVVEPAEEPAATEADDDSELDPDQPRHVPHPGTHAARSLRQRSRLVAGAWALVVALVDAFVLRRTTLPNVRRGRIVIRDRYALDSVVQLLEQYGPRHRLQSRLIAGLAPRPIGAFLLDVPADTAWRRKPEEYNVDQLERHRRSYLARAPQLGVVVVDADRDPDEISTDLVMQVWHRLP